MPHWCREHCPPGRARGWLTPLLAGVLVAGGARAAVAVAPAVDAVMSRAVLVMGVVAGLLVVLAAVRLVAVALLNCRARARFAVLEREACAAPGVRRRPATLTEAARQLDAAPVVRVQAVVDRELDRELDREPSRWAS